MSDSAPAGSPTTPLACVPDAIPVTERGAHFELAGRLFAAACERRELAGGNGSAASSEGYGYRFSSDMFDDVVLWVRNERRCCPFLGFAIHLSPDGGALWMRLTGPENTRAFLDAELPVQQPTPAGNRTLHTDGPTRRPGAPDAA